MKRIKKEAQEFSILLKSVPTLVIITFVLSVFSMNLLANKSITLPFSFLALDCGIIVSWVSFLSMDIITKHFGPKAATEISVLASFINLIMCFVFYVGGAIPGVWGESFVDGSENIINSALDNTFSGTWYVLFGSTAAFLFSAFINNFVNFALGKLFKKSPDGFFVFAARTYVSTAIGQFADNLTFALIVSHIFFGWTFTQCVVCAVTGMAAELLCEVLFSALGYKITVKWKSENVGKEYFELIRGRSK